MCTASRSVTGYPWAVLAVLMWEGPPGVDAARFSCLAPHTLAPFQLPEARLQVGLPGCTGREAEAQAYLCWFRSL